MSKKSEQPTKGKKWLKSLGNLKPEASPSGSTNRGLSTAVQGNMFNPLKSVGLKLFIIFITSNLLIVTALGMFAYNESKKLITNEVSTFSQIATQQTSDKMNMIFDQFERLTMRFLLENTFQDVYIDYVSAPEGTYEKLEQMNELESLLSSLLYSEQTLNGIELYKPSGEYVYAVGSSVKAQENVQAEEWFQETMNLDGRSYWIPTGVINSGEPVFGISRLIKNSTTSQDVFILRLVVDYAVLDDQMKGLDLGEGSTLNIVNTSGTVIYSDDESEIGGQSVLEIPQDEHGRYETSGNFEGLNRNGVTSLISFSQAYTGNDWYVMSSVPLKVLTSNADQIFDITLLGIFLSALVAVLVGVYMVMNIGRPLVRLRDLMNEGEKGNLAVRISLNRKDEIGQLGISFNRMMEQITQLVKQTSHSADDVLGTAEELSSVSKSTALSAKEISVASEQIAEGASTLAVQAENGNEIVLDIRERMKVVVDTNLEMGKSANDVLGVSNQGTEYMKDLIAKTDMTEQMTRSMVEKVDHLQESTASIRKILDLLNNITKQTNILSLNATIEAARAGAAGKGFMVVADEIRKLADQSRESIDVVGQITETIQQEIEQTVSVLSDAYPIFQEQMASVKETDQIFSKVRDQMADFIQQLDEVTQLIQDLDQSQNVLAESITNVSSVSQESSATSEQVASLTNQQMHASEGLVTLSEKLENLSKGLKESLSKFKY